MKNILALIGVIGIALIVGMMVSGGLPSLPSPVDTEESTNPVPNVIESVRAQAVWEGSEVLVTATPNSSCTRKVLGIEVGSSEDTGVFIGNVEAEMDLSDTQVTASAPAEGSPRTWTVTAGSPELQPARVDPDLSTVDHDRSGWSCGGRDSVDLWREADGMLDDAARETDAIEIAEDSFEDWITNVIRAGEPDAIVVVEFVDQAATGA